MTVMIPMHIWGLLKFTFIITDDPYACSRPIDINHDHWYDPYANLRPFDINILSSLMIPIHIQDPLTSTRVTDMIPMHVQGPLTSSFYHHWWSICWFKTNWHQQQSLIWSLSMASRSLTRNFYHHWWSLCTSKTHWHQPGSKTITKTLDAVHRDQISDPGWCQCVLNVHRDHQWW